MDSARKPRPTAPQPRPPSTTTPRAWWPPRGSRTTTGALIWLMLVPAPAWRAAGWYGTGWRRSWRATGEDAPIVSLLDSNVSSAGVGNHVTTGFLGRL